MLSTKAPTKSEKSGIKAILLIEEVLIDSFSVPWANELKENKTKNRKRNRKIKLDIFINCLPI